MAIFYGEPTHDYTARTTATSQAEGRLKDSYLKRKKKRKIIMDGMGGCGKKHKKY